MTQGAVTLNRIQQDHVAQMLNENLKMVCAFACAIEPTHVHLLVGPVREPVGRFVGRLKGASSSKLGQALTSNRTRIWTSGYWKVFIRDCAVLHSVARYIRAHNVRRGLPSDPYDWLTPLPEDPG